MDPLLGYVMPAKALAMMAVDLLWGDAAPVRQIVDCWVPRMSREAYLAFQRGLTRRELFDGARD